MSDCLIAFGANLSIPKLTFQSALSSLRENGFKPQRKSGLWRSPAWPEGLGHPDFINAVVSGQFSGSPEELLELLLKVEAAHGRERSEINAPRTLDLDLLTFGKEKRKSEMLTLPHPRMKIRAFVLVPASEIESKWVSAVRRLPFEDVMKTRYVGRW